MQMRYIVQQQQQLPSPIFSSLIPNWTQGIQRERQHEDQSEVQLQRPVNQLRMIIFFPRWLMFGVRVFVLFLVGLFKWFVEYEICDMWILYEPENPAIIQL